MGWESWLLVGLMWVLSMFIAYGVGMRDEARRRTEIAHRDWLARLRWFP